VALLHLRRLPRLVTVVASILLVSFFSILGNPATFLVTCASEQAWSLQSKCFPEEELSLGPRPGFSSTLLRTQGRQE